VRVLGFSYRELDVVVCTSMASNIDHWLQKLGLEKYGPIFAEQEIDESVLTELTESDLENLGLPLGPRKKYSAPSRL
jgi:hypothetical protein